MSKLDQETAAAIAAYKGEVKRLPDGEAYGADGRMSTTKRIVLEYLAVRGPVDVKPYNGGSRRRRFGARRFVTNIVKEG